METVTEDDDIASKQKLVAAPWVFVPSVALLLTFVLATIISPDALNTGLKMVSEFVVRDLGWYYVALVSGIGFFCGAIAMSPLGRIVLGKNDDAPEFSLPAWFAMLFAAGMGIGLVFFGVAEPLQHFLKPPPGTEGNNAELADAAMDVTFLHWGVHAWAIYAAVGLAIAVSVHRRGRPVSIRWAVEPVLGKHVNGPLGDLIDVVAVVGTLFGVATSLGFGVQQVGSGLEHLGVVSEGSGSSPLLLVPLIVVITGFALLSVASGLDKGIKILSNANMGLAAILFLTVLILGPTFFLMNTFVQQLGSYLGGFFRLSFRTFTYQGDVGATWISGWTTYYWGWWMSWAPFVGVFIARISRGRTVREFILGVLVVPTVVTFAWFSVLGGTALWDEIYGSQYITEGKQTIDKTAALFRMFDILPGSTALTVAAMILVVVFFVTSSDSGSFVVDMLASGGNPNPPLWSRIMWGTLEGLIAAALLLAGSGSLEALQTMAILAAAPFSVVIILMCVSTVKSLQKDHRIIERAERTLLAAEIARELAEQEAKTLTAAHANTASGQPEQSSLEPPGEGAANKATRGRKK